MEQVFGVIVNFLDTFTTSYLSRGLYQDSCRIPEDLIFPFFVSRSDFVCQESASRSSLLANSNGRRKVIIKSFDLDFAGSG